MKQAIRLMILLLPMSVLCSNEVFGQDFSYKARMFGGIGAGNFLDDEGSLGKGLIYRTGAEWRPLRRLGIQGELLGMHHTRRDSFDVTGNAMVFSGNAAFYFSSDKAQPYVLLGLGALKSSYDYGWPASNQLRYRVSRIETCGTLGGGILLMLSPHWSLDPQVRSGASYPTGYVLATYISITISHHRH